MPPVLMRRCHAHLALVWDMHSAAYCQLDGIMRGRHASSADTLVPCVSCIGMRHALSSFRPLDRVMQGRHASSADTPAPCISCIGMRHAFSSLLSPWWSNAREACLLCLCTGAMPLLHWHEIRIWYIYYPLGGLYSLRHNKFMYIRIF